MRINAWCLPKYEREAVVCEAYPRDRFFFFLNVSKTMNIDRSQ